MFEESNRAAPGNMGSTVWDQPPDSLLLFGQAQGDLVYVQIQVIRAGLYLTGHQCANVLQTLRSLRFDAGFGRAHGIATCLNAPLS